nr:MAG TPA: hypothetical protein [Caudoviricetes sp.]
MECPKLSTKSIIQFLFSLLNYSLFNLWWVIPTPQR